MVMFYGSRPSGMVVLEPYEAGKYIMYEKKIDGDVVENFEHTELVEQINNLINDGYQLQIATPTQIDFLRFQFVYPD